ncbi:MAG TPA: hypothetical protein VF172_06460 [Nitrososphaera sp.]|jgi:hypothetical protein
MSSSDRENEKLLRTSVGSDIGEMETNGRTTMARNIVASPTEEEEEEEEKK